MGYRLYIKGQTAENKIKDDFCIGKLYGYNNDEDGLMLGYTFIMQTAAYKEYRKDENTKDYTDYDIIDLCFTAGGSIDMHLLTDDFRRFLDLYYNDYINVWHREFAAEGKAEINKYLSDCISVFTEWF